MGVLLGWVALIVSLVVQVVGLYAASAPGPQGVVGFDKLSHVAGFGVPAALAWLLRARWLVTLMTVHAFLSEPLQGWVAPTRMADPLDLVADLVGIALGVGTATVIHRARRDGRP